jgi:hypothetical protein
MSNNMKNILEYKSLKVEADRLKISEVLIKELLKFNFEEDYLKEGDLQIENASEITFNSCVIENYTETRSISESNRPNRSGVPQGSKRISEFNVWDYKLSFDKEFQNSTDNHDILESHHAIGCGTCKQQGKIRCSSCRGAGDVTCSSCNGRGEKQCGNCNGRVDIKCWSCSGKGTKETGYGENKRTERCSSCSGRGSNKCTSCSNGFVTCSTCSGSGKVTCYTCHGSGEVTCYQCDGNRTMDHFFIVSASFINLSQTLYLTNPYPGFDQNKSKTTNCNIQSKLFDIKEPRFKESHFNDIKSSPFYRQITSFLDFTNNERTKLIASRITCFENKYFEVTFNFYGEKYTLFLDKNFENSYYNGKKPSDQYELDLLKKSIDTTVKNELSVTKKTIQKLSKYDFISISEKEIISAIEDTENIYEAHNDYKSKNYTSAENTLRLVSNIKKSEDDFVLLRKKINRVYFVNTLIVWLIGSPFIFYLLKNKASDFVLLNVFIAVGILLFSLLLNKGLKNIHYARFIVISLLGVHFILANNFIDKEGEKIESEDVYIEKFNSFKKQNHVVYCRFGEGMLVNEDSIIIIEPTGAEKKNFYLPIGKLYSAYEQYTYSNGSWEGRGEYREKYSKDMIYLDIDENSYNQSKGSTKVNVNKSGTGVPIEVYYKDIIFDDDETTIEVKYMRNNLQDFKGNIISRTFLTKSEYKSLKEGIKDLTKIESKKITTEPEVKKTIEIGTKYNGGIIIQLDETGEHGMIMSEADLGSGDWDQAVLLCKQYTIESFDDWRLPTIEELHIIYANKSLANNFEQNWYWSSTEDTENSDYAFHLGFMSGDEMSIPKRDGKFIRAVRNF